MRVLGVAAVVLSLAAVATGATSRVIRLTARDDGRTVAAHVGDTIVVKLSSNASTGYAWKVAKAGAPALKLVSARYVPPKAKPNRVGVPGTFVAKLAVSAEGRGRLRLVYVRHTTPETPPAKRFTVLVLAS